MIFGSKSTSAQSLKMALARARALKMCSGGVMTETRLDVLLLTPHLRPKASKLYLREMNAFYCSRIHYFRGKNWQLRSVKDKNGRFFVAPVIINTGGSAYNRPIFSDVLLKRFIPSFDRSIWCEKHSRGIIHFPTPLGDDFNLFAQGWDDVRVKEFDGRPEEETVMYNLVGHELADLIVACNELARNVLVLKARGKDEDFLHDYFESTVLVTVEGFRDVGATEQGIRREVQSMMLDPMTDWNSSSLPVPDQLWKSNSAE
eukprot:symbB.v1.2.030917.t1/scaffold3532.1/size54609/3